MHVLVTGGAGFVGSHIVEALLDAGHDVRVLDLVVTGAGSGAEALLGDVRNADDCARALRGVDAVCHQAAKVGLGVDVRDLPAYAGNNDLGTAVLLAQMASTGVDRLVLASSMVVYGEGAYSCAEHGPRPAPPRRVENLEAGRFEPCCPDCGAQLRPELVEEDARLDPRNAYAASKVAQEHLAAAWARGTGGTVISLRYHNVYGPRMPRDTPYAGVAAIFASALARGEAPQVFEDGGQRRDFVHVRDVAAANVVAHTRGPDVEPGEVRAYNVGSGVPRTVGDLAAALATVSGGAAPRVTGAYRLGDVRHVTASSQRLRSELGWSPQVDFGDGVRELSAALTEGAGLVRG